MSRKRNSTAPQRKRNLRAPVRVDRRQQTDVAIVTETVKILKARGSFNETLFRKYLNDAGWFVAVPDEITPQWLHSIADHFADEFAVWLAGGLQ